MTSNSGTLVLRLVMYLTLFWMILVEYRLVETYRSPDDYYFNINKDENLYDTGTLPDGEDVTVYLFKNEPQSYFLTIDGQSSPVSITVVPCSSMIEWKVYFHAESNQDKRDSLEGDPLFLQEGSSGYDVAEDETNKRTTNRFLHTFRGRDITTFKTNGHLPKGIIRLVLTTKESNSRVQIYASGARQTDLAIPIIPEDDNIEIAANDKHSVTVVWKQSPSHKQWGQHIEYCVTFNPRRNYRTLCSVYADLEGEVPPPWPKNAGFGFRSEEVAKKRLLAVRRSQIRRDINLNCVSSRHWASITSLLPGRRYYVDVFAINRLTNRSASYTGSSLITEQRTPPLPHLKSGTLITTQVGGSIGPHVTYNHELKSFTKKLVVFVQTLCSQDLSVDLIYEGAITISQDLQRGLRKLVLVNAEPGNYSVRLNSNIEDSPSRQVRMCIVGRGSKKCPYSGTPNSRFMNATTNLASCLSVTLQWMSADVNAKYCLHVIKDPRLDDDGDDNDGQDCSLSSVASTDEKSVFCRVYKKTSPQRNGKYIVETVWDLETKKKYNFRLQVVLKKGVTVDYEPVVVYMDDDC